jgi:hypothetical protein
MNDHPKPSVLNVDGIGDTNRVRMLYQGNGSAQIRGKVTGQIYQFPRQQPVQAVDPRDAGSLIRTHLFTPVR